MIAKTKEDQKKKIPSFFMADQALNVVNKVRYVGQINRNNLSEHHCQRQCCKLYVQTNMLAREFHMCTDDVKTALFRAHCAPLYTAHLWCCYSKAKMKKLQEAFNDAFGILLKLPRWTSASHMFVSSNVPPFQAVMRNFMYKFMC